MTPQDLVDKLNALLAMIAARAVTKDPIASVAYDAVIALIKLLVLFYTPAVTTAPPADEVQP